MQKSIADELLEVERLSSIKMNTRVSFATAREILIKNKSCFVKGSEQIRFYQLKDLGLGVYEVRLRPPGKYETIVVKEWEEIPSTGWGDLSD